MNVPARRSSAVEDFHGVSVSDPYDWLDDAGSAETQEWRAGQAALTERVLSGLPDRARFRQILERTPLPVEGLPIRRGTIAFTFGISENGGATLLRDSGDKPRTVFDPARHEGLESQRLQPAFTYISPTGRYLAAGLAAAGSDWPRLRVFDLETATLLPQTWSETAHLVVDWLPDESGFFYNISRARFMPSEVRDGVYRHELGRAVSDDSLEFEHAPDMPGHAALPMVVQSGSLLLVKIIDFVTQKASLHAVPGGTAAARQLLPFQARCNIIGELGAEILIETDLDAPRGRIMAADPAASAPTWREVVPQREEALELSTHSTRSLFSTLAGAHLFATYVKDAAHRVLVFHESGKYLGEAGIGGLFTVLRTEAHDGAATVSVTRFNTPCAQYRIDAQRGTASVPVPDAWQPPLDVHAEQIFCNSDDGTRIPIFVVRPRDAQWPLPTLLYGYGGWGSSLTPSFRPDLAAWVARGGAYAIVNTRGGGEYGETWHEAGARLNRIKTFEDYCAAGAALIATGICPENGLAARGLSNGGLLVCAVANRRPELFAAVSAGVPLVDVVHLMRLPAGAAIAQELGDPTASRAAFDYMRSYSPLQNVKPDPRRPAMLLSPAERDDRVSASSAYKHVAALQATAQDDQVALLRVVEGEGHTGWPDSVQRDVLVDELAFLWWYANPAEQHDVT